MYIATYEVSLHEKIGPVKRPIAIVVTPGLPVKVIQGPLTHPDKSLGREGIMARERELESEGGFRAGIMDEALIEVFGCVSLGNVKTGKIRRMSKAGFASPHGEMDEALIEVFGCVSLDRVVRLDTGRERRLDRAARKNREAALYVERGLKVRYH